MRAGQLRERVEIQRRVDTPDGGGGVVSTWVPDAVVWARVQPEKATEILKADRVQNPQRFIVQMRYRDDVTPDRRLKWLGRVLEILSVGNEDERRSGLVLIAEQRDTN